MKDKSSLALFTQAKTEEEILAIGPCAISMINAFYDVMGTSPIIRIGFLEDGVLMVATEEDVTDEEKQKIILKMK